MTLQICQNSFNSMLQMVGYMMCKLYLSKTVCLFVLKKTPFLEVTEVYGTEPTLPIQEANQCDTTG